MSKFSAMIFVGACLAVSPALAETVDQKPGPYFQINLGSGVGGEADVSGSISGVGSGSTTVDLKPGVFASAAVGQSFKGGLALELEGLYQQNDGDTKAADRFLGFDLKTSTKTWGAMANALYAVGAVGPVVPYVGGGVGYGKVNYSVLGVSDGESGFMWQVRAGLSVPVTNKASWDVGYRYLSTPRYKNQFAYDDPATATIYDVNYKIQTRVHVVTVGVRVRF